MIASMNASIGDDRLPLSALLSMALVAFTIEFDNEFEHQAPHRTTDFGSTPGFRGAPWLVSMVMWSRFLRFVPDEGITVRELLLRSGSSKEELKLWLTRLSKWWGYLAVLPAEAGAGSSRKDMIVRPTAGGRKALEVWRPLTAAIEERWEQRFGRKTMDAMRESLRAVAGQLDASLPDSLPILGYGLFSKAPDAFRCSPAATSELSLPGLLSKVLLAFAIEFERASEVSLAIAANVLRLVEAGDVRLRNLPRQAGVSKEAIATAVSFLEKRGYAAQAHESATLRAKVLLLTAKGRRAAEAYLETVRNIEEQWRTRFGGELVGGLREALERLAGEPDAQQSPLMAALRPCPDCWRASLPAAETLPHFPMILHRGGFPDGS